MSEGKTVIVHGPMGCGKTQNAGRIAAIFDTHVVVDDWDYRRHAIVPGAIHLSQLVPLGTSVRTVAFDSLDLGRVSPVEFRRERAPALRRHD